MVPMVGLVPTENNVIPMVLLVNTLYASRTGDLDYFLMWPGWVHGNFHGPLVPMV